MDILTLEVPHGMRVYDCWAMTYPIFKYASSWNSSRTFKFTLNSAGLAGFFGGKEAISAMATSHLYTGRRWLSWYNSPGSYTIAKHLGRMANSHVWDGSFPGSDDSPDVVFSLDGKQGYECKAVFSRTTVKTGYRGYLSMVPTWTPPITIDGRETTARYVSYLGMKRVDICGPVELLPFKDSLLCIIPITFSVAACIFSGSVYVLYSFSLILLDIIFSGLASVIIGDGKLVLRSLQRALLPATAF